VCRLVGVVCFVMTRMPEDVPAKEDLPELNFDLSQGQAQGTRGSASTPSEVTG
jgi:hypothetical protein